MITIHRFRGIFKYDVMNRMLPESDCCKCKFDEMRLAIRDAEAELDEKEKHRKHKMRLNRTLSIGILKNDLTYILLETDAKKQDQLFRQIYEDISKRPVPIRPNRHDHQIKGQLAGKYSNTHKRAY